MTVSRALRKPEMVSEPLRAKILKGYLHRSGGWELGTGPSIVVVDKGLAKSLSSTTVREGVYAFFFAQKGLMAGLSLQGSKITEITPDR